jgi:hypothetical protein
MRRMGVTPRRLNCNDQFMQPKHLSFAVAALAILTVTGCASRRNFADRTDTPQFPVFTQNVKTYTALVDSLAKDLGALPDKASPEKINEHRRSLAAAIQKARAGAKQGDLFPAGERAAFLEILRSETKGRQGAPARKTIAEDNPKGPAKPQEGHGAPPVTLAVNAIYPDGAPRSTVPPTVLLRLPKTPETVEFRFVGKALVLYDARANLIVDFIPNALP